jgi:HEAT repeat protein
MGILLHQAYTASGWSLKFLSDNEKRCLPDLPPSSKPTNPNATLSLEALSDRDLDVASDVFSQSRDMGKEQASKLI